MSNQESLVEKQKALAEKGLDNTLAFEEQRLEEANLAKLEAEKEAAQKEQLLKTAEIFGEAYIARLREGQNQGQALGGATADAFVYRGIAKAIIQGAFYEGTENVADSLGEPVFKGKDGYVIAVDGQERILNPEHSKAVKGMSNKELVERATMTTKENSNSELSNKLDMVVQAIKSQPIQKVDVDKLGNIIETIDKQGFKRITKFKTRSRL